MKRIIEARFFPVLLPLLIAVLLTGCASVNPTPSSKLYFGHPLNSYNTEVEAQLLKRVIEVFPGWNVENPNQKHHSEGVERWRGKTGNPMHYFYEELLPQCCSGGIFLPLRDGSWTAGVYGEAKWLLKHGYPIWQIDAHGFITQITAEEFAKIKPLSVEETRARYKDARGNKVSY